MRTGDGNTYYVNGRNIEIRNAVRGLIVIEQGDFPEVLAWLQGEMGGGTQRAGKQTASIPMLLDCPRCHARHIDVGTFATKPHHTHACQVCGMVWRPALVDTVGVAFLPGFKNETADSPKTAALKTLVEKFLKFHDDGGGLLRADGTEIEAAIDEARALLGLGEPS